MQPLAVSVKEKGENPDKKPYPLPYGLRNLYRLLKPENSQDYAQKPQRKLYVHEFGFWFIFGKLCPVFTFLLTSKRSNRYLLILRKFDG
jgi:hypothetical protein